MITLDEAISHAREVARVNRLRTKHPAVHRNDEDEIEACLLCAVEHEQLAEWLEELKAYREIGTVEECRNSVLNIDREYNKGYADGSLSVTEEIRGKAIDDFAERLSKYLNVKNATKYGNENAEQQRNSYDTLMKYEIADAINDIAEQLKEGWAE